MKKKNAGFTLVETIVVIAILGVLMAVLVPRYIQYVEKSRAGVCSANREIIFREMKVGVSSGKYPDMDTAYEKMFGEEAQRNQELSAVCPSKGSVSWDEAAQVFTCDKHGGDGSEGGEDGGEETPPPESTPKPGSPEGFGKLVTDHLNDKLNENGFANGYTSLLSMSLNSNNQKVNVYDSEGNLKKDENGKKDYIKFQPNALKNELTVNGQKASNITVYFTQTHEYVQEGPDKGKPLFSTEVSRFTFELDGKMYAYDAVNNKYEDAEPPKTN